MDLAGLVFMLIVMCQVCFWLGFLIGRNERNKRGRGE